MSYRNLRRRLESISDAAFEELESRLAHDPEQELEKLPEPINSEEHAAYVECLFAAQGVRAVAASATKVARALDRDRAAIGDGSRAEQAYERIVEFAERALASETTDFRDAMVRYENARSL